MKILAAIIFLLIVFLVLVRGMKLTLQEKENRPKWAKHNKRKICSSLKYFNRKIIVNSIPKNSEYD